MHEYFRRLNIVWKSKKIWLVLDSQGFGGIESHVEQLMLGLLSTRNYVNVVFLKSYGEHPLQRRLLFSNLNCTILDGRITSLWRALKKDKPDIIHTHGYKAGIIVRPIARFMAISCASTFHSGEKKDGRIQLYDWFDRYTAFLAHHVYAVNTSILSTLPCKATLADNFIDTHALSQSHGQQIAFVGRLNKEKAPERFINLAKYFPCLDLHLYGDGPMRKQLEKKAPDNIVFHGVQREMHNIWPKIGLLILPSRAEGLPMVCLEAMARGIPVITFNVGALNKLIFHEQNGWIFTEGDLESMTSAIQTWRESDPAQKAKWSNAAILTIKQHYSTEKVMPKLLENYATFAK
ncbi:Glycosyltransferase SypH [Candidatus Enterovibrio altilux]|uniref:Glycosyltransferase SypH n=1 Tax=Candidatus Enterovibrio altilux TaxID=1927128 RepID=A0A291B7Q4_9GAMM|nr:Glycosyltransferase SypH [Candidatus Enterovibrio luxaltus]